MLSYLDTAKQVVDEAVYARGIRLYLEGRVGRHQDMLLDFWREYGMNEDHNRYVVRLPLLHLALNSSKWDRASQVLKEHASCECAYYQEYGLCKHVVAVCASLEKEFGIKAESKT